MRINYKCKLVFEHDVCIIYNLNLPKYNIF
jgi:hypothetical protein